MKKYKCPKCGMEYDSPGKCEMDGAELVEAGQPHEHTHSAGHEGTHSHHSHHDHHKMMMEDFKKRFFVSIIVTVPILVLSPLVQDLLGFSLKFPGSGYILFALSSFVFFWGGLPFLKGIITELKQRRPGMMTLIALAISVAYFYSSVVMFSLDSLYHPMSDTKDHTPLIITTAPATANRKCCMPKKSRIINTPATMSTAPHISL